jgi:hypothetical protein
MQEGEEKWELLGNIFLGKLEQKTLCTDGRLILTPTYRSSIPSKHPTRKRFNSEGEVRALLKTWILLETNEVNLWNKLHFRGNVIDFSARLKNGVQRSHCLSIHVIKFLNVIYFHLVILTFGFEAWFYEGNYHVISPTWTSLDIHMRHYSCL